MKKFNKIVIIGVGLIGGSLGLAVRRKRLAKKVTGVFRRRSSLIKAVRQKAVDEATMDFGKGVRDADLVILAVPVGRIADMAKKAAPFMKRGAILTDVGSTKGEVTTKIEKILPKGVSFVGSHPMAGSEKSGVAFARQDLFKGSLCIVTRTGKTRQDALRRVRDFWEMLDAKVKVLSPGEHDLHIALVSHLPHIAACALSESAGRSLFYAATGFRDTTRIASSEPELWLDIFISNRTSLLAALAGYIRNLEKVMAAIKGRKESRLLAHLKKAKSVRDRLD